MNQDLKDKYYVKKSSQGDWVDITTLVDGLRVLSVSDMNSQGKPVNVFTQQFVNNQEEDFMITTLNSDNNPVVIRENIDISITFIVGNKYATNAIDVRTQHDAFIDDLTSSDVYIKSAYTNKEIHCACIESYKPTTENLQRGFNSYMMGTIKLHALNSPSVSQVVVVGDLYIGFGGDTLHNGGDITSLANVQHYNKSDASGNYTIVCPSLSYLWICTKGTISGAQANGFTIPMESAITIGEYNCYRTSNNIMPHTMSFEILTD